MTKLIFIAYRLPISENGKVVEPASLVRIEQQTGGAVLAKGIQRYARTNKQFKNNSITLDSFNGKYGFNDDFYTEYDVVECLKMLTNEGYTTKRMTRHNENELADSIFKEMYTFNVQSQINKHGMKLPI